MNTDFSMPKQQADGNASENPTRSKYPKWKHRVDRAAQKVLTDV
jgi:hypothetical protein